MRQPQPDEALRRHRDAGHDCSGLTRFDPGYQAQGSVLRPPMPLGGSRLPLAARLAQDRHVGALAADFASAFLIRPSCRRSWFPSRSSPCGTARPRAACRRAQRRPRASVRLVLAAGLAAGLLDGVCRCAQRRIVLDVGCLLRRPRGDGDLLVAVRGPVGVDDLLVGLLSSTTRVRRVTSAPSRRLRRPRITPPTATAPMMPKVRRNLPKCMPGSPGQNASGDREGAAEPGRLSADRQAELSAGRPRSGRQGKRGGKQQFSVMVRASKSLWCGGYSQDQHIGRLADGSEIAAMDAGPGDG